MARWLTTDSQIEDARVQLRYVPVGSESVDVEVGMIGV
jgi:hypothetical protein